jgi:hypothetical protein
MSREKFEIWKAVYVAYIQKGGSQQYAAKCAAAAVEEFDLWVNEVIKKEQVQ